MPTLNDRQPSKVSMVQTIMALLALAPFVPLVLHSYTAVAPWMFGNYQTAVWTAILMPGGYDLLLGLAFPLISVWRKEMNQRALLIGAMSFLLLAVFLVYPLISRLPELLGSAPPRTGYTRWINAIGGLWFHSVFLGYALGFTLGSLLALSINRKSTAS